MGTKRALHAWERLSEEQVYQCRIFTVRRDHSRFSRDLTEHDFHVLECPDWVNITFVAYDVVRSHEPTFDSTEETEVVLVPFDDIPACIRDGTITHALVVVAFHWLALARR